VGGISHREGEVPAVRGEHGGSARRGYAPIEFAGLGAWGQVVAVDIVGVRVLCPDVDQVGDPAGVLGPPVASHILTSWADVERLRLDAVVREKSAGAVRIVDGVELDEGEVSTVG